MENYYVLVFCEFCQYYSKVLGYQLKSFGFQSDRANIDRDDRHKKTRTVKDELIP